MFVSYICGHVVPIDFCNSTFSSIMVELGLRGGCVIDFWRLDL